MKPALTIGLILMSLALGRAPIPARALAAAQPRLDFDGDGRSDLAAFSPSTGVWTSAAFAPQQYGLPGDIPVAADYDGDGDADIAVFRPSTGEWYVAGQPAVPYGLPGDFPMPADYDGDGRADFAVRTLDGQPTWYVRGQFVLPFGMRNDVPFAFDFDGDGKADPAFYRPNTEKWQAAYSSTGFATTRTFNDWGGWPLVGDFDGDGLADLAVHAVSLQPYWFVSFSSGNYLANAFYSAPGFRVNRDRPIALDLDGDGRDEIVWYDPNHSTWTTLNIVSGTTTQQSFGALGDTAVGEHPHFDRPPVANYGGWGAGKTLFRPSTSEWFTQTGDPAGPLWNTYQWGLSGDTPVPGDFDGDRRTDLAVWRPSSGTWYLRFSSSEFVTTAVWQWGLSGDVPVAGDYDGDRKIDLAVWRPASGEWFVRLSSTNYATAITAQWGLSGDTPLAGDYDHDGRTDFAVWRPNTATFYIRFSSGLFGGTATWPLGLSTDIPLTGDFDGDGFTDVAFYRPPPPTSTGFWYGVNAVTGRVTINDQGWGLAGDIPVPWDWTVPHDGATDLVIFRPSTGEWWQTAIDYDNYHFGSNHQQFGIAGDIPLMK